MNRTKQWKQQLKVWGFKKNLAAGDMTRIVDKLAKTDLEKLSNSYVKVDGLQVPLSRIKRHAQRTGAPLWREVNTLDASSTASQRQTHSTNIADDITLVNGMVEETPKPILFAKDGAFDFSRSPLPISTPSNPPEPYGNSRLPFGKKNAWNVSRSRTMEPLSRGDSGSTATKFFACPYFKHNPLKFSARNTTEILYRSCATAVLRNTASIKQHLYRVHKLPDYYCARCLRPFAKASDLDSHVYSCSCDTATFNPEGKMTQDQYHKVKKRKTFPEQQNGWYEIFDILFPHMPRPASPYVEDTKDQESVNHFVNLFQSLGPDLTQQLYNAVAHDNPSEASNPTLPAATGHILNEAYDTFIRHYSAQSHEQWLPPQPVAMAPYITPSGTRQNSLVATEQAKWMDEIFPSSSQTMPPYDTQLELVDIPDEYSWVNMLSGMDDTLEIEFKNGDMEGGSARADMDLDFTDLQG